MRRCLLLAVLALLVAACSSGAASTGSSLPATPDVAHRPSTDARVSLISPTPGEVVHGNMVNVVIGLSGATITRVYSTHVNGHQGHIHLYLDNQLIYMNYTLEQEVPVHPGFQYSLYAEFVAADHFPFSPRDRTPTIYFTVAG